MIEKLISASEITSNTVMSTSICTSNQGLNDRRWSHEDFEEGWFWAVQEDPKIDMIWWYWGCKNDDLGKEWPHPCVAKLAMAKYGWGGETNKSRAPESEQAQAGPASTLILRRELTLTARLGSDLGIQR